MTNLTTDDKIILETMEIDLIYLTNKYEKKINPKYTTKVNLDDGTLLIYNSGINLLMKKNFNDELLWIIIKLIVKDPSFRSIKLRKDKDFSSSAICTTKNISKIKAWYASNTIEYETLSLFFVVDGKGGIKNDIISQPWKDEV